MREQLTRRSALSGLGAAGTAGIASLSGCLSGNSGSEAVTVDLATFVEGTAWYVMGSAMNDRLTERLPSGSTVNVLPYAGTEGNIDLLRNDEADVAFGAEVVNKWARDQRFLFDGAEPYENLRSIVGYLDLNWIPTAIKTSVAEEHGIETYADIAENQPEISLGIGPGGSISHIASQHLYDAHGFTLDEAKSWGMSINEYSLPDMPSAISSGDIDGLTYVASEGHATWTEITGSTDMRFLPVENFDSLTEKDWSQTAPLPEGEFGASADRPQIGFHSLLMTDTSLDNETAYAIAETVVEDIDELTNAHAAMSRFDVEEAVKDKWLGAPLHDGAREYYEENGYL